MRSFAASTRNLSLNVDIPRRRNRHVHVAIVPNAPRSARDGEIVRIVLGDLPGGRLARRVRDDLEAARDEPVLVDRVVVFCRDDIEADVVRLAVSEDGNERSEVEEVGREVDRAVGCDRSPRCRDDTPGEDHGISDTFQRRENG